MSQYQSPDKDKPSTEPEALAITPQVIGEAEKLAGLSFTDAERELMLEGVNERLGEYQKLRTIILNNDIAPALFFSAGAPERSAGEPAEARSWQMSPAPGITKPANLEDLAFYPVSHLAHLIRTRQLSSVSLTEMYLSRLKRYDPALKCVVTLTEALALAQAKRADQEIAAGHYRGPLHGIPWGAKDLLQTHDIPTTWGAMPFKEQVFEGDATVVQRLEAAGAVLVAKLTLGALAWGDVWFGGQTKNPWNLEDGSSGSSAGSAAAVAAGLVGFAIGTETYGSIVSPCTRCGVTGLRPTFGRVSRQGAMALSWSMDKIGPIARTVEDCALIFDVIHGADGEDSAAVTHPFHWQPMVDLKELRIGYLAQDFAIERDNKAHDEATLVTLRSLVGDLIPIELPNYPISSLGFLLMAEAAAAFDTLTRDNLDDLLVRQTKDAWPNVFRQARLIPAVEYIQANRIRRLVMQEMAELMSTIDLYVAPSLAGDNLLLTNLTGHPAVVLPNGFSPEGIPNSSITFTGRLFEEAALLAVAKAYQDETAFHLKHPPMAW
jgi:Asp-tRNA(Asn)/Glu-tRNA(Gln) amidotransferase A subunit family amidase